MLEFLGLLEQARFSESDLEAAIINQIEHFLLELGKGFLFEARQKRFTFDDDHFFVDLVFYNRLLRCYVLIDLKIGKLTLTASQSLRRLRDPGLLAQKGRGSATYYVPTERLLDSGLCSNPDSLSSESDGLSTKADTLSTNPEGVSAMLANEQDAQRKALLNELPGSLAARIGAIGQRHLPGEVCDAIVEVCRLGDWRGGRAGDFAATAFALRAQQLSAPADARWAAGDDKPEWAE